MQPCVVVILSIVISGLVAVPSDNTMRALSLRVAVAHHMSLQRRAELQVVDVHLMPHAPDATLLHARAFA